MRNNPSIDQSRQASGVKIPQQALVFLAHGCGFSKHAIGSYIVEDDADEEVEWYPEEIDDG